MSGRVPEAAPERGVGHTTPQRVLVTGAASGLGAALVAAYRARGDEVLATDVAEGTDLRLDITSDDDWAAALRVVEERWGGLDVLVNNAGVAGGGRIDVAGLDEWQWIIDINLLGVVRGCRTFTPLFKRQGSGRIVNIASLAGLVHPAGMASYNAVKAGVVALTETLGHELAGYGVRAHVVCPSYFRTNLLASMRGADQALGAVVGHLVESSPFTADQIAAAVLAGIDAGDEVILPDPMARAAYDQKLGDRPAYDEQMRRQAARLDALGGGPGEVAIRPQTVPSRPILGHRGPMAARYDEWAAARTPSLLAFASALADDDRAAEAAVAQALARVRGAWSRIGHDDPDLEARRHVVRACATPRRAAVVLRLLEERSDSEIAEVLRCSEAAARRHLQRGFADVEHEQSADPVSGARDRFAARAGSAPTQLLTRAPATEPEPTQRRHRRASWLAALGVLALVCGVPLVSHLSSEQDGVISYPKTVAPATWRYESYAGVQLRVPDTWGWGASPVRASIFSGPHHLGSCGTNQAAVLSPADNSAYVSVMTQFVGRPAVLTDRCMSWGSAGTTPRGAGRLVRVAVRGRREVGRRDRRRDARGRRSAHHGVRARAVSPATDPRHRRAGRRRRRQRLPGAGRRTTDRGPARPAPQPRVGVRLLPGHRGGDVAVLRQRLQRRRPGLRSPPRRRADPFRRPLPDPQRPVGRARPPRAGRHALGRGQPRVATGSRPRTAGRRH